MRPKRGVYSRLLAKRQPPQVVLMELHDGAGRVHYSDFVPVYSKAVWKADPGSFPNGLATVKVTVMPQ